MIRMIPRRRLGATPLLAQQGQLSSYSYQPPSSGADVPTSSTSGSVVTAQANPCALHSDACLAQWREFLAGQPRWRRECLKADPKHKQTFMGMCCQVKLSLIPPSRFLSEWNGYVAKKCPAPVRDPKVNQAPPPPPPDTGLEDVPVIDHLDPTDAAFTLPDGASDDRGGAGATGSEPVSQATRSPWRTVGPVVGIGLLVAAALTLARKKKGKRRAKR